MASAYLYKNQGTATNAKKFTYSVWLKRSTVPVTADGNTQRFYQGYETSNNRFYSYFTDDNKLWIYAVTGGTIQLHWVSNRLFRDINAWYHIVFKGDTTQSAQADRFRVYVNGVEETSWTKNYNIAQNVDWGNLIAHTNNDLTISGTESQGQMFDGLMSHIHFIDGTAYDASAFGSTDTTTGEWKINTTTTVTYGNAGYFILKDDNSNLDRSGNNNHFTIGGTLTKTEDCPSNVFATLNPLAGSTDATFSNGNTKVTFGTASSRSIVSTTLGAINGKYYWEMKLGGSVHPNNITAGVGTKYAYDAGNTGVGGFNETWGITPWNGTVMNNGSSVGGTWATFASGDIMQFAVNLDDEQSGLNKFYIGKNGTWLNGADPSNHSSTTGVVGITKPENGSSGFLFPLFGDAGDSATPAPEVNFGNGYFGTTEITTNTGTGFQDADGNGRFFYNPPTNFRCLSTKGLNQ